MSPNQQNQQLQESVLLIPKPDLSTHILDTSSGTPASNVRVVVEKVRKVESVDASASEDCTYVRICEGRTDKDGRIKGDGWVVPHVATSSSDSTLRTIYQFGKMQHPDKHAQYRITFHVKDYFQRNGIDNYFFPVVQIVFVIDERHHYHVPLLLSPFGYSTYRGS